MGTASTKKFIKLVGGDQTEEFALLTSAGTGDANRVPALNGSGILDASIVNSKASSAGAADVGKLPSLNAAGILDDSILNASVASSPNKIPKLDAAGKLDITVLPTGIGADTAIITTSEALAAGDFVHVWNSTGAKVRKADATTVGKKAMGFVLAAFGSGVSATVYFEGTNNQVIGQVPGDVFLQTVAGTAGATVPSATGNVVQNIGFATSATSINFQSNQTTTLA